MQRYLVKRLFHSIIVILGISLIVFIITHLTGDPTDLLIHPEASREERELLRKELGLDRPLYVQYFEFLKNAFQGDFGKSFRHQTPAFSHPGSFASHFGINDCRHVIIHLGRCPRGDHFLHKTQIVL